MDSLGFFDQFFYKADQYNVLKAVMGGASILEPTSADSPLDARAIAGHLANRLGGIALMRTKFVQDPLLLGTVKKVDDPDFDIWEHIFVESLPAPGGYQQLSERLAELSATPLELSQMWRWTVIDGLADGKLAVMCNIHHAVADGVGIVEALNSIYNASPIEPEQPQTQRRNVEPLPGALSLLGHAIRESTERLWIKTPLFLLKNTGPILGALGRGARDKLAAIRRNDGSPPTPDVSSTSLNISHYSDQRAVSWKTLPLPQIKQLARHFDATVNDVGLLLYSYAMEHYFAQISEKVNFDLWCGMPISTRSKNSAAGGNQVAGARVCLHNTVTDPVERLAAIHRDAEEIKQAMRPDEPVVDTDELASLLFPPALDATLFLSDKLDVLGRMGGRMAFVNALFSNVPGPRQPVYVANGRMTESIPMIPAVNILAVTGGITSVDQNITIGFLCDSAAVVDAEFFLHGIEHGLALLSDAAGKISTAGTKSKSRSRSRSNSIKRTRHAGARSS